MEIQSGEVVIVFRDSVTDEKLGSVVSGVLPRRDEHVKIDGEVRRVFDVQHEFDTIHERTIHRVKVRLTSPIR